MPTDAAQRLQIERALRRELKDSELVAVRALNDLTPEQLQIVAELRRRDPISPVLFLSAVVPDESFGAINTFARDIHDYIAAKAPPAERRLDNESLFERTLGRSLSAGERRPISTLEELSPEQRAAAASMYARNIDTAILYVAAIASKVTAKLSEQWIIATFESSSPPPSSE